jgi:hypothetical protein
MTSSEKEFAEALKEQHCEEFESQRNLDSKATSTLSIGGIVSGLLFGFGTFLLTRMEPNFEFAEVVIGILGAALIANIFCVGIALWAFRVRKYTFVMSHEGFFHKGNYTEEVIKKAKNYNETEINRMLSL